VWTMQPTVLADKYDDQIRALQKEIEEYQSKAGQLQTQIATLQEEISGIDTQKKLIQAQISLTESKLAKLQEDIATTEKNIQNNKVVLGKTLADLYIDDTISPLEMLASSHNLGDYVDKQEYRGAVREQLSQKIETIKSSLRRYHNYEHLFVYR